MSTDIRISPYGDLDGKRVSILVAVRNEEENIERLLQSIYNQSYSKDFFELVIVDDHSSDDTLLIIERFVQLHKDLKIRVIRAKEEGKKRAVAEALHQAENEIVLVTDADCVFSSDWLISMLGFFMKNNLKMLLGPVLLFPADSLFEKLQVLEHLSLIGSTAGSAAIGMPVMCNGANMMYSRTAALEVEKFRTDMDIASGDDMFLLEQFVAQYDSKSVGFILDRNAIVRTRTMPDLKSFMRQRRRWASKTKSYTNGKIIATALIVLMFCLSMVLTFLGGLFVPKLWLVYLISVIIKTFIDLPLLSMIASFTKQRQLLTWVLPLECIYPFYIVIIGLSSLLPCSKRNRKYPLKWR
ncbi:MAG: glycosyltransferase [Candidatus Limimorpha sp.]